MSNTQRVTVELKNGKFRLAEGLKADDLNPKALILYSAAQCAGPACQYTYLWKSLSLTPYFLDADETVVATDFSVAGMPQNYLKSPLSWEALNENSTEEEISSIRYGQTNLSIGN